MLESHVDVKRFPGICENGRYSKCPPKFTNPQLNLKVGTGTGVPGDSRVSRRGDISGERIILIAKHHGGTVSLTVVFSYYLQGPPYLVVPSFNLCFINFEGHF